MYETFKKNDLNFKFIENFNKEFLPDLLKEIQLPLEDQKQLEITNIYYCFLFRHVENFPEDYQLQPISQDLDIIKASILSSINLNNIKLIPGYTEVFDVVQQHYTTLFRERHF